MIARSLLPFLISKLKVAAGKHGWLTALIWLAAIAPATALDLRIAIQQNVKQINVGSSTKAVVRDESSGQALGEIQGMNGFTAQANSGSVALDRWKGGLISVEPTGGGVVWIGDRWYRGRVVLVPTGQGLTAVNYVNLEQYLYSVLGSEMNGNWPQEALKAQAVAARSYALYQRQSSANSVFDLGDTDFWQVYTGVDRESVGTQMAVNATAGEVLTHKGQIINAVFHSSSGGCIDNVEEVWTQPLPYLRAKRDFDQGAPVYQWSKTFDRNQLSSRITGVGEIESIEVDKQTTCKRIVSMRVKGSKGTRTISGDALRSALDLRSTLFSIVSQTDRATKSNDGKPAPTSFVVNGNGFGHGLGLSQYGAYNLALQQRWNYQQIVLYYYDNTKLAKIEVK
jgi:stage II sporulation protein D